MHSISINKTSLNRQHYPVRQNQTAKNRNGELEFIDAHSERLSAIDRVQTNTQVNLSVRSFYYRSSTKTQLALCSLDIVREIISQNDPFFELSLPSKSVAATVSQSPDALRKQIKRNFDALKPVLEPFHFNEMRSSKSWKCEIAAIILAFFGKVNKIPKRAKSKINSIFGSRILQDQETALIKSQLTKHQAENWGSNTRAISEVFKYAGLDPQDVMGILR